MLFSESGSYSESLKDGGKLNVWMHAWNITYYFSGPDRRHSGTFVTFGAEDIPKLIEAYEHAFTKYIDTKAIVPPGAEMSIACPMQLTIRVGGYFDGVCLASYHIPIRTNAELQKTIDLYRECLERAPRVQAHLKELRR